MLLMTEREDRTQRLIQAGAWLAAARKSAGLTQDDVADAIGTSGANVSNYERGQVEVPDEKAARLAEILGRGEIETRRALGMYVPEASADAPVRELSTPEAIKRDPNLIPEARKHLLNQYELLRRLGPPGGEGGGRRKPGGGDGSGPSADILELPHAARKRTPRKPRP